MSVCNEHCDRVRKMEWIGHAITILGGTYYVGAYTRWRVPLHSFSFCGDEVSFFLYICSTKNNILASIYYAPFAKGRSPSKHEISQRTA